MSMSQRPLAGQTAFVSGSTAGIGMAIVQALLADGARVILNGRQPQAVQAAVSRLREQDPQADVSGIAADLGTAAGCEQVAPLLADADILVNNLGIFEPKPFEQIADADWQRLFEVNVMSGVRLSRAALPGMLARNRGRIVFISSESGIGPPAEMVHYGMSKSAQLSVARGLAECCAGTAVTVNSVLPGPTRPKALAPSSTPWPRSRASASTKPRPASSAKRGPPRCCAASSAPTKSPRWWPTSAARRPALPPAPRCGWTVAWCARSPESFCFSPGVNP